MSDIDQQWAAVLGVAVDASAADVCRAFVRLARTALAPIDLRDIPLYSVPLSSLPSDFQAISKFSGGWYHDYTYFWLQKYLAEDRGPGAVLIVVDVPLPETLRARAEFFHAALRRMGEPDTIEQCLELVAETDATYATPIRGLAGTLTHELAHALVSITRGGLQCAIDMTRIGKAKGAAAAGDMFRQCVERNQQRQALEPQHDCHDRDFIRTIAHLDSRLRSSGVPATNLVIQADNYGHRPYVECFETLRDEAHQQRVASFAEIARLPVPAAFAACTRPPADVPDAA